ncbi:MAG: ParB/RepB/Spo0J family partition protein [Erysipelothrix sp.]|nr:ParB/RepB/Spo0J family partition protein [Erysipelothrix sp.]
MSEKKLGRGLGAIFGEGIEAALEDIQQGAETSTTGKKADIDLAKIHSNPYQPRKIFDEEKLDELATSIRQHGVFTPILVREALQGFELVAGERRVLAARRTDLKTIPAIIVEFDDEMMMEIGLLENIQREDLNVIEEAMAYAKMREHFGYTQVQLAERVGKTREHIANISRLLKLPESVQQMVVNNELSMGHVRPLITLNDEAEIKYYADEIVAKNLSVRAIEQLMRKDKEGKPEPNEKTKDPQLLAVAQAVTSKLGTKVVINDKKIIINYTDTRDLNRILEILDLLEK